jgi:hypothetical protein
MICRVNSQGLMRVDRAPHFPAQGRTNLRHARGANSMRGATNALAILGADELFAIAAKYSDRLGGIHIFVSVRGWSIAGTND